MKIQVNSDSSVDANEGLAEALESDVLAALDRFSERLTRVEIHVGDEDSPTDGGQRGKRCLLEARPSGLDPVVVTGSADTVEGACHDACQKMQSLLDSTFGRIDSRDADATIRQNRD